MIKLIQIANLLPSGDRHNSLPGRVYSPKGICPCLRTPTGGAMPTNVFMDKTKIKLRYAIGRTNKPNEWSGKSGTANFHVNPVFACVTSTQWSNRGALIVEIK